MDYKAIIDGVENVSRFGKLFGEIPSQICMHMNVYNITKISCSKRRKEQSLNFHP